MPLTLASLVQHSALKLSVRAGEGRLDTPVRWAHVSELADPVPYMEGGELLLITAMKLDAEDPQEMRRYVRRLAAAGVVGIGFAVGVNYDAIPRPWSKPRAPRTCRCWRYRAGPRSSRSAKPSRRRWPRTSTAR